jgi:hypothetical protein
MKEHEDEIQNVDIHYRDDIIRCGGDSGSTGRAANPVQTH